MPRTRLHVQDPTDPETVYLFESLAAAFTGSTSRPDDRPPANACVAAYAFASVGGVRMLFENPALQAVLERCETRLIVGIDRITSEAALRALADLEGRFSTFTVKVFPSDRAGLFHPKAAAFAYPNGRRRVIAGSGNLTEGGLSRNVEVFTDTFGDAGAVDTASWDGFFTRERDLLNPLDPAVLARAAENRPEPARAGSSSAATPGDELPRFLVMHVASYRWPQFQFSKRTVAEYFGFELVPSGSRHIFLRVCRSDGTLETVDPPRPLIYSESSNQKRKNQNTKIEVAGRRDFHPDLGLQPVAVFRRDAARHFAYMILLPGEPGYGPLHGLAERLPKLAKSHNASPQGLATSEQIANTWPHCPLL